MTSCPREAPELEWNGKIWTGDADSQTIMRQDGRDENGRPVIERISCEDPEFNRYRCIIDTDHAELIEAENTRLRKCLKWSDQ